MFHDTFLVMGNVFYTDYPVLSQLEHSWSSPLTPTQILFLDESNGNFEFGFFKNTQDKFNGI